MTVLHFDIEGFSPTDVRKVGAYKYAEDPLTRITLACFAFDDEPLIAWVPTMWLTPELEWYLEQHLVPRMQERFPGSTLVMGELLDRIRQHIESGGEIRAFNANFERTVCNANAGQLINFPRIKIPQVVCVMAKCGANGVPQKLEHAAKALGTHPKDKEGHKDMMYLARPRRNGTQPLPVEEPERYANMVLYCMDDVMAERAIDHVLEDLSPFEQQYVYALDQRMNDRGWAIDLESIDNIEEVIRQFKVEMSDRCVSKTGLKPTQVIKLREWVTAQGYPITDMRAVTVAGAVADKSCPEHVKEILGLYSTYNMKAVSKYASMRRCVCADGRVRGMFVYWGAGPGRWTARLVQLQNLMRPLIKDAETAVEAFRARDLGWIRDLYSGFYPDGTRRPNPMLVASSCVRSCLVAGPGHDLVFPDFSGVEARGVAFLFDDEDDLEVFRRQDAKTGPDAYRIVASEITGEPPEKIDGFWRQIGKVVKLSLGAYQGAAGAFKNMVPNYKIDLDAMTEALWPRLKPDVLAEAQESWLNAVHDRRTVGLTERVYMACDSLKVIMRRRIPKIVNGWYTMERLAIEAVEKPGTVTRLESGKAMFKVEGTWPHQWLVMRLPSGRRIKYYQPQVRTTVRKFRNGEKRESKKLVYMGVDTKTRRWGKTSTYGGKLTQNWNEGHCRDLLVAAKLRLEKAGYLPVGTIHDEPITEIEVGRGSWEEAKELMLQVPAFSRGMPIAVEGRRSKRYGK